MASSSNDEQRESRIKSEDDLTRWIEEVLCPELGNWKLIKLAPINAQASSVEMVSLWEEKFREGPLLRMDITLFHTHQQAIEYLYRLPNEMVHPVFAENGGPLPMLGDARLVTCRDTTGEPVRTYFTRGNVMVAIMNGAREEVDITDIAAVVDSLLNACLEEDQAP